ncbi:hypothetical protein NE555_16775, partial [Alistipes onderdonkii]|uniref:hypothetical protein n=1 Tax=Alistipes onderdonkii TaxID=328813 RepID=UPI002109E43D
ILFLFWSGKPETDPAVFFRYVSECYGDLSVFSSPFAPRCISMCQYEDRQSFRQKQIFYSIYFGGAFYHIRRNPSGRTIPPLPRFPPGGYDLQQLPELPEP